MTGLGRAGTELVRPRFLPDRDAGREWGGKGAALARLIRSGFRVPPSAAFGLSEVQRWVSSLPSHAPALAAWRRWTGDAPAALARLREEITATPVPAHFGDSVETLKRRLCGGESWPWFVRSSMSVEDVATASFAGAYETVRVDSSDPETVWAALARVVASAYSEPAALRLLEEGLDPLKFRAGAIVQPCLEARAAGVCFSRDPSNPWSRNGLVEWAAGPAEGVVQGTVPTRTARRDDPGFGAAELPLAAWKELWSWVDTAERLIGGPADVEWVWDGEQLWFVQCRPISTEEARLAARSPGRRWSRELTLERFPEPLSPMGWSTLQDAFTENLRTLDRRFGVVARRPEEMAVSIRGVVYSDPDFFKYPGGVRVRWLKLLAPWRAAPWRAARAVLSHLARRACGVLPSVSRTLLGIDLADAFLSREAGRIEADWSGHVERHVGRIRAFTRNLPTSADAAETLRRMDELAGLGREFMEPDLAVYLIKDTTAKALAGLWNSLGFEPARFTDLVRGLEGNRTLEMNRDWDELVSELRRDPASGEFLRRLGASTDSQDSASNALGAGAKESWLAFLERNGQTTTTWDVAVPVWSDAPGRLASLLEASLRQPTTLRRTVVESPSREKARSDLRLALGGAGLASARPRVYGALRRLETFMRIDEEHHFHSGLLLPPSRRLILGGAEALCRAGVLQTAEEAFYVEIEELKAALADPEAAPTLAPLAARRASESGRSAARSAPSELPPPPHMSHPAQPRSEGQGIPMSPGVARGPVVVAEHIDQARGLQPGSILVTTSPNPALTPLYPLLAGIVSATGGALSHGFVSAREYALPAVSGIVDATRRFTPGMMVEVDGTTGSVRVLDELSKEGAR